MRRTILLLSVTVAIVFSVGGVSLAAGQLDQQQTTVSSGIGMDATYPMAQTFTAGSSGSLDAVSVHAARVGTTEAGDMLLSIQSLEETGLRAPSWAREARPSRPSTPVPPTAG